MEVEKYIPTHGPVRIVKTHVTDEVVERIDAACDEMGCTRADFVRACIFMGLES